MGKNMYELLLGGVNEAICNNTKFTSLLQNLRLTLIPLLSRISQYDQERSERLLLSNEESRKLQRQMEEGVKLVGELASLGMWNYHCRKRSYSNQLEDLFASLRRLLCLVKQQEDGDTNELLRVARNIFEKQNDVDTRLCGLLQVKHNELGSIGQVKNGGGGHDLDQVLSRFLELLILEVDVEVNGRRSFKPVLVDLISTSRLFQPLLQEISQYNNILHLSDKELENLREQLQKGVDLVGKCSEVHQRENHKKYEYFEKLLELDEYLRGLLCLMRKQIAKDMSETLVSVCNLEMTLTRTEELVISLRES